MFDSKFYVTTNKKKYLTTKFIQKSSQCLEANILKNSFGDVRSSLFSVSILEQQENTFLLSLTNGRETSSCSRVKPLKSRQ